MTQTAVLLKFKFSSFFCRFYIRKYDNDDLCRVIYEEGKSDIFAVFLLLKSCFL